MSNSKDKSFRQLHILKNPFLINSYLILFRDDYSYFSNILDKCYKIDDALGDFFKKECEFNEHEPIFLHNEKCEKFNRKLFLIPDKQDNETPMSKYIQTQANANFHTNTDIVISRPNKVSVYFGKGFTWWKAISLFAGGFTLYKTLSTGQSFEEQSISNTKLDEVSLHYMKGAANTYKDFTNILKNCQQLVIDAMVPSSETSVLEFVAPDLANFLSYQTSFLGKEYKEVINSEKAEDLIVGDIGGTNVMTNNNYVYDFCRYKFNEENFKTTLFKFASSLSTIELLRLDLMMNHPLNKKVGEFILTKEKLNEVTNYGFLSNKDTDLIKSYEKLLEKCDNEVRINVDLFNDIIKKEENFPLYNELKKKLRYDYKKNPRYNINYALLDSRENINPSEVIENIISTKIVEYFMQILDKFGKEYIKINLDYLSNQLSNILNTEIIDMVRYMRDFGKKSDDINKEKYNTEKDIVLKRAIYVSGFLTAATSYNAFILFKSFKKERMSKFFIYNSFDIAFLLNEFAFAYNLYSLNELQAKNPNIFNIKDLFEPENNILTNKILIRLIRYLIVVKGTFKLFVYVLKKLADRSKSKKLSKKFQKYYSMDSFSEIINNDNLLEQFCGACFTLFCYVSHESQNLAPYSSIKQAFIISSLHIAFHAGLEPSRLLPFSLPNQTEPRFPYYIKDETLSETRENMEDFFNNNDGRKLILKAFKDLENYYSVSYKDNVRKLSNGEEEDDDKLSFDRRMRSIIACIYILNSKKYWTDLSKTKSDVQIKERKNILLNYLRIKENKTIVDILIELGDQNLNAVSGFLRSGDKDFFVQVVKLNNSIFTKKDSSLREQFENRNTYGNKLRNEYFTGNDSNFLSKLKLLLEDFKEFSEQ